MKISGQLEWQDYLKAQYLHMRPSRLGLGLMIGVLALFVLSLISLGILAALGGQGVQAWLFLLPVVFLAGVGFYIYVMLPWNVRRIFAQQKELAAPFEHEITETALNSTSQYGNSVRPWSSFHKWKENQDLLLLYLSDIVFVIIPKHFCTPEQIEAIRGHLAQNGIPQTRRNPARLVMLVMFFVMIVAFGVLMYVSATGSVP